MEFWNVVRLRPVNSKSDFLFMFGHVFSSVNSVFAGCR